MVSAVRSGEAPPPRRLSRLLRRVGREPLFQFLLIGALLFLGMTAVSQLRRPVVQLDGREINQLVTYWEIQTQRPPTKAELDAIIADRIDEELLAREALRLGLDKDDMIIRRRLAQKMAFASEDVDGLAEPDDAALKRFYEKAKGRYVAPARVALRQGYFSGDRPDAERAALDALARAQRDGHAPASDPFVLPLTYADVTIEGLQRDYGPGYAKAVAAAPTGTWVGPVRSPFGWHVLRVEARHAAELAPFESVRDEVRDAYLADRRKANNAAFLRDLRKRYRVVIAGGEGGG